jgi:hypothetical protein
MAPPTPAPELVFEVYGFGAWEFVIGKENRTKLLFAIKDGRNLLAHYLYSERLSLSASSTFDLAAIGDRKFDKQVQLGTQGQSWSPCWPKPAIRVDQFARLGLASIRDAKRTDDELVVQLRLDRKNNRPIEFDVKFYAAGYDKPTDIKFPMLGAVVMLGKVVQHSGAVMKPPQGFDAAKEL